MKTNMYILVRDIIPVGIVANNTAKASVACYLGFKDDPRMIDWLNNSLNTITCKVSDDELGKALSLEKDFKLVFDSSLGGELVCVAFCPRETFSCMFKFLSHYW